MTGTMIRSSSPRTAWRAAREVMGDFIVCSDRPADVYTAEHQTSATRLPWVCHPSAREARTPVAGARTQGSWGQHQPELRRAW